MKGPTYPETISTPFVRHPGDIIVLNGAAFMLAGRCELRWPGLCSQTPYAVISNDWSFAAVACRKHAQQAEMAGYAVHRLKPPQAPQTTTDGAQVGRNEGEQSK